MNNFQLLTPVLYFFCGGVGDVHIGLIKNIQSKLITCDKAIQYVSSLSELPAAHTAFLKTPFNTVGEIRVNFVVNMSSAESSVIDQVIEDAYNFLQLRYTTFVTVDVYCILDESGGDFGLMSESLAALDNVRKKNILNICYMLSNINSKGISNDDYYNIYESIAYMPLVLDCAIIKDIHGGWFDERYFKQLSDDSQCCAIGSLVLKKPDEAVYNEAVINVIEYFKQVFSKDVKAAEDYTQRLIAQTEINLEINIKIELEDIFAVLENTDKGINRLVGYTNIELINNIFEDRIDAFIDLNISEQSQAVYNTVLNNLSKNVKLIMDEALKDPKCGLFGLSEVVHFFDKEILPIKKEFTDEYIKSQQEVESWQNSAPQLHKKTVCLFSKKYLLPYETAYAYIKLKLKELNKKLNLSLINELITVIKAYGNEVKYKSDSLARLSNELKNKNNSLLKGQPSVITQNFSEYYKGLTYEFINADEGRCEALYSGIGSVSAEEAEKNILIYAKNVVVSELFSKSLVEEINCRVSRNRAIYDNCINGKNYNIYLRSGESGKHREICLFTNNPSDFSAYAKEQGVNPEFDKLDIMYGLDKSQIILIYLLGVFTTEDLFYRELYIGANK